MAGKDYTNVIVVVRSIDRSSTKINRLVKISSICEDERLKELTEQLITAYGYYIKPGASRRVREGSIVPVNNQEWINYIKPIIEATLSYCNNMIATMKPQWQIIAERNGWQQPIKSTK